VTLAEAITANSLTFDISGYTVTGGGFPLTLTSGNATVTTAAHTANVNAALGGTNGLTKLGAGTLSIGTAGTYIGNTTVSAGTLALGANDVFNASGLLDIASSGRFNVYTGSGSRSVGNEGRTQTFTGLTGSGTLAFGQGNSSAERFKINLATGDTQTFSGALVTAGFTGNNNRPLSWI